MAVNNLKDFNLQWILFGLLFFCLLSFAIYFMALNSTVAFGDSQGQFTNAKSTIESELYEVENNSDRLLNISAQNDPTIGQLGSEDSVATSYGITGNARGFFDSIKIFFLWIFIGDVGKMLLSIFGGMFAFTALYYITKWIRAGF